ncbi:MAG: XRE family transcriptional regulator [Desulfobacteraceae bacterium]|nr:MAG: XRE family transcriptional regulator [Desulfobacteraceae bacterium]
MYQGFMNKYLSAKFVKQTRNNLNLTQEQLAEIMSSKQTYISRYERGINIPSGNFILQLIEFCEKTDATKSK